MTYRVAIVGSTLENAPQLAIEARKRVAEIITYELQQHPDLMIVSGGAKGVDTFAKEIAEWNGIPTDIKFPEHPRWAPNGYKERNMLIAEVCDKLYRVFDVNTKTWGSGFTRMAAQIKGKPVVEYPIGMLVPKYKCLQCGDLYATFHVAQSEIAFKHHVSHNQARSIIGDV